MLVWTRRRFILDTSLGVMAVSPLARSLAGFKQDKLGVALVGLGGYSNGQLGPALKETQNCYLAGIVTGTPEKAKKWSADYNIPDGNIYNYENFDRIADNKNIDIVYVVLPVSMHKEFTIRAAKAGKHVICEKPMAISSADCQEMIDACKSAKRLLSIGYRLHFEPYNLEMQRLGQQKVYGKLKGIQCENGFKWGGKPTWRLQKALSGGGALMDMGIYAIQGARYTTGEEPVWVQATEKKSDPDLFREVDDTIDFTLEFPSGCIARGVSSYSQSISLLKATAERGEFGLTRAYGYSGQAGFTPEGPLSLPHINQQARQMDDFARCVRNNEPTRVPGEMGKQDLRVIEAIYRSISSGKKERVI